MEGGGINASSSSALVTDSGMNQLTGSLPAVVLPLPVTPTLPYSCVLVDYTMPEMSGPVCVRHLRDLGYTGVVIGVTGHATAEATDSFISHGANSGP